MSQILKLLKKREFQSLESNKEIQQKLIEKLLLHCYENVPYYRNLLAESEVVVNNKVYFNNFSRIPILTKDILRDNFERFKCRDLESRKWYFNTSGGSTGEPSIFIQDQVSWDHGMAGKWFFSTFTGKDLGDKEIKLWGSETDLLKGSIGFEAKIKNLIFNRILLNSFKMTEEDMEKYVELINQKKPVLFEAYVQSIYELSKFILNNNLKIYSPRGIITSTGTLHPEFKETIQDVFKTKVYNRYGSREVGDIACSCERDEGLHLNIFDHYIEILNESLEPCKPGEIGEVYVTALNNYAMPLIRYRIGDMASPSKKELCSCGRGLPLIENVIGRSNSMIKTENGVFDSAAIGSLLYFKDPKKHQVFESIKKYQIIQKKKDYILIKIVPTDENIWSLEKKLIEAKLKKALGNNVKFDFNILDDIEPNKNGKYMYTISEVE
ncbi:MAG: phenylacetate--CoA ligase family protein [Methanosarcinaceae archaeon]|uniref:phenylacetate--CoA ligase family protein n=1 Tax=Methanosarcina sp. MTP4 TaxID=1434100 RepID=UPI0012E028A2|nr:phenylacetate--CoA ligase family protein [Methanosarcina sp. MTP4]